MMRSAVVFLIFVFVFLFSAGNVLAIVSGTPGSGASTGGFNEYRRSLEEPGINLQQFSFFNLDYTAFGLTRLMIGVPQVSGRASLPTGEVSPQNYGAFGIISSVMAQVYTQKPVSGVEYLAGVGRNFSFIKPAYAQPQQPSCPLAPQQGFDVLCPVRLLWSISRNLAYLAFVVIFVAIGFMVMLRARIDPRTVATVQAAIPGIVISLILVTFSFAIAGLIFDIAQVATSLIANAMGPVMQIDTAVLRDRNIFVSMFDLMGLVGDAAQSIVVQIIEAIPSAIANLFQVIGQSGIGQSIVGLFFGILVVFTAFKVFMMLLTALVTIVLMTIGAPFMFLVAAIPGRGGAIVGWFRSIAAAALTFPLTFLLLALAAVFLNVQAPPWGVDQPVGDFNIDLIPFGKFGKLDEQGNLIGPVIPIAKIIGLGILLMTPKVADMLKEAFQQKVPEWAGEPGRAIGGLARRFIPFA